jgi:hypothetical protein
MWSLLLSEYVFPACLLMPSKTMQCISEMKMDLWLCVPRSGENPVEELGRL